MYRKKINKKIVKILLLSLLSLLSLQGTPISGFVVYANESSSSTGSLGDNTLLGITLPEELSEKRNDTSNTLDKILEESSQGDIHSTSTIDESTSVRVNISSDTEASTTQVGTFVSNDPITISTDNVQSTSVPEFITLGEVTDATTKYVNTFELRDSVATGTDDIQSTFTDEVNGVIIMPEGVISAGTTTIQTGDSFAMANILNITNTNLINSTGSIIMANMMNEQNGSLDLRGTSSNNFLSVCTLVSCNGVGGISVKIEASSTIDNTIVIVADSGSNQIQTSEISVIHAGDTYAGLNLVNIANTNLIDSNYLLLSLNSFKNFNGDIVLPSLSHFFSTQSGVEQNTTSTILQIADTVNNLDVLAHTGGNSIESLNGSIHTGSSISSTNVYNNSNTSFTSGSSVSVLLKVSGTWLGELFGTPLGSVFSQDGDLNILTIKDSIQKASIPTLRTAIMSTSTSLITNNVSLLADSGTNTIFDTTNAQIDTGNAYASANIINIANANIVGRNWILAIINIFGDFNGNISFGKPDLWLGEQVSADNEVIHNGTVLTYKIAVINKGDSDATNVKVSSEYNGDQLSILTASIPYTKDALGNLIFSLGTLLPNEAQEIIFQATIHGTSPGTKITMIGTATEHESDNNSIDNKDITTITTTVLNASTEITLPEAPSFVFVPITITPITITPTPAVTNLAVADTLPPTVVRTTSTTTITESLSEGEQVLVIYNHSNNTVPSVVFNDSISDAFGNKIRTETFNVGDILPGEEVTLTYKISFGPQVSSGTFALSSELVYLGQKKLFFNSNGIIIYTARTHTTSSQSLGSEVTSPVLLNTNIKKVTRYPQDKTNVLGALTSSFLPEKAFASVTGEDTSSSLKNISYPVGLLNVSLFIFGIFMYRRHIRFLSR